MAIWLDQFQKDFKRLRVFLIWRENDKLKSTWMKYSDKLVITL